MIKLIRLILLAAVVLGGTVLMALPKGNAELNTAASNGDGDDPSGETTQPTTNQHTPVSAAGAPAPAAGSAGPSSQPTGAPRNGGNPATGNRPAGPYGPAVIPGGPTTTGPILPGQPAPATTRPQQQPVPGTTIIPPAQPRPPAGRTVWPKTHVIQSGETFQKIAKRYYGGFSKWRRIADANPGVDPTRIRPGQKLKIPAPDRSR